MSWEGYGQALCANGHEFTVDRYDDEDDQVCDFCKAKLAWVYWVDQTNGCCCPDDRLPGSVCAAHPKKMKLLKQETFTECPTCRHKTRQSEAVYEIPKD